MGVRAEAVIDDWLRCGGFVVAASDRAARALRLAYHQRRRAEGSAAWIEPDIQAWESFVISAWQKRSLDDRMMLNRAQERALWAKIIGRETHLASMLEATRRRLAGMAIEAHELLCSYAPHYLKATARHNWDRDPGAFSGWLAAFDEQCQDNRLLSPVRTSLDLIRNLQNDATPRPPMLAVGFDRLLPIQTALFEAWETWRQPEAEIRAQQSRFFSAVDQEAELRACANWCMRKLSSNKASRLLIISQDIGNRRGEIERAFLRLAKPETGPVFEFSLGIPLIQTPLARAANLLLRWMDGPLAEFELDWLFSTGFLTTHSEESTALQAYARALRRRGLARPEWTLEDFTRQAGGSESLPPDWLRRMIEARQLLSGLKNRRQNSLEWTGLVARLLQVTGFSARAMSSVEFQTWRRWDQALDACGSLGFDGRLLAWKEFLFDLAGILDETLFAPESSNTPIQIAGPAESAGLTADAIWFLGADEDNWPSSGSTHPFLPIDVQRDFGMPHAKASHDRELAQTVTNRLLAAAPEVLFSYAQHNGETESRPSRLVAQLAGPPLPIPSELVAIEIQNRLTVSFQDLSQIPFSPKKIRGGSKVLTSQSQCPFKAFAIARLGAESWEPAEFGLSASQRGLLLHAVLHAVWGGPPDGLHSLHDLLALSDLNEFVQKITRKVLGEKMPLGARDRMPPRYLQLEGERLTHLVTEWLKYEATRAPFTVAETETTRTIDLAGLTLDLRLDRIDQLKDGSLLVIDYKSGDVSPKSWELPRPDDVQLPLYAGFALNNEPGGLVFAKVRIGKSRFVGQVRDATANLIPRLSSRDALLKLKLMTPQMSAWKQSIEQLARDFVAGCATVDPRDFPKTCETCDLQSLCRIHENRVQFDEENDGEEAPDAEVHGDLDAS
jgi:ATP-dependent helicase/nuclease subunit B